MRVLIALLIFVGLSIGCQQSMSMDREGAMEKPMEKKMTDYRSAVFAGGCFWCTESDFEKAQGVVEVVSGYTGGHVDNPTYQQVSNGGTGHVEAVKVIYDPTRISYEQLLKVFWQHVDPTDGGGQFVDRGDQYRSAIFYANTRERELAEASKMKLARSKIFDKPIVTDILPLGPFYEAEEYHQDYHKKNSFRYKWYRNGSGRDKFLKKAWANRSWTKDVLMQEKTMGNQPMPRKPDDPPAASMPQGGQSVAGADAMKKKYMVPDEATLRRQLTPMQFKVTRRNGTEPAFKNAYWDNHKAGIYVGIVSGEPLFSSMDKFDSGTGWPSFTRPLEPENIVKKADNSLFMMRTEVRSKHGDSHLGHLFDDGPPPTGLRYCINSAALRFIPKADLEKEGYGEYALLFPQEGKKSP